MAGDGDGWRAVAESLASGLHSRLGADSPLALTGAEVLRQICLSALCPVPAVACSSRLGSDEKAAWLVWPHAVAPPEIAEFDLPVCAEGGECTLVRTIGHSAGIATLLIEQVRGDIATFTVAAYHTARTPPSLITCFSLPQCRRFAPMYSPWARCACATDEWAVVISCNEGHCPVVAVCTVGDRAGELQLVRLSSPEGRMRGTSVVSRGDGRFIFRADVGCGRVAYCSWDPHDNAWKQLQQPQQHHQRPQQQLSLVEYYDSPILGVALGDHLIDLHLGNWVKAKRIGSNKWCIGDETSISLMTDVHIAPLSDTQFLVYNDTQRQLWQIDELDGKPRIVASGSQAVLPKLLHIVGTVGYAWDGIFDVSARRVLHRLAIPGTDEYPAEMVPCQ